MNQEQAAIIAAYEAKGNDACTAKGGGFFVRGRGLVSLRQARQDTGINMAQKRYPRVAVPAWGDYAIIAMLNTPRK